MNRTITHTVQLPRIIMTLDDLEKYIQHYRLGDHGIVEIDNLKWWQLARRNRMKKFYNHTHKLMSVRVKLVVEKGLNYNKKT